MQSKAINMFHFRENGKLTYKNACITYNVALQCIKERKSHETLQTLLEELFHDLYSLATFQVHSLF